MDSEIERMASRFMRASFWLIETTPSPDGPDLSAFVVDHLNYQIALEKRGILFAAGPISTSGGQMTGAGLIVLRGESEQEVRGIVDADPMHRSGARTYTLRQWHVHEGRVNISINLSESSARLD